MGRPPGRHGGAGRLTTKKTVIHDLKKLTNGRTRQGQTLREAGAESGGSSNRRWPSYRKNSFAGSAFLLASSTPSRARARCGGRALPGRESRRRERDEDESAANGRRDRPDAAALTSVGGERVPGRGTTRSTTRRGRRRDPGLHKDPAAHRAGGCRHPGSRPGGHPFGGRRRRFIEQKPRVGIGAGEALTTRDDEPAC